MIYKILIIIVCLCSTVFSDRLVQTDLQTTWINQAAATTNYSPGASADSVKILGTAANVATGFFSLAPLSTSRRQGVGNISDRYLPAGTYPISCSLCVKAKSIGAVADSTVNFFYQWKQAVPLGSAGAYTWNRYLDDGETEFYEWGTAGALNTSNTEGSYNLSDSSGFDRKTTAVGSIKFLNTTSFFCIALDTLQLNDGLFLTGKQGGYVAVANALTTNIVLHGGGASSSNEPYFVWIIQDMYPNRLRTSLDIARANTGGMAQGGMCLRTARGKSTTNANAHALARIRRPWIGNP